MTIVCPHWFAACNFKIDILLVSEYAQRYLRLMYPALWQQPHSPLRVLCDAVCNDSCYTYANLCFETYSVALACAIVASQMLNLPLPFADIPDTPPEQNTAKGDPKGETNAQAEENEDQIQDQSPEQTEHAGQQN